MITWSTTATHEDGVNRGDQAGDPTHRGPRVGGWSAFEQKEGQRGRLLAAGAVYFVFQAARGEGKRMCGGLADVPLRTDDRDRPGCRRQASGIRGSVGGTFPRVLGHYRGGREKIVSDFGTTAIHKTKMTGLLSAKKPSLRDRAVRCGTWEGSHFSPILCCLTADNQDRGFLWATFDRGRLQAGAGWFIIQHVFVNAQGGLSGGEGYGNAGGAGTRWFENGAV